MAGFYSRWAAALLALVCIGIALGVHLPAGDPNNMIHFYKNLVMTGGFLYVIAFSLGAISLDREAAAVPAESHRAAPGAPFRRQQAYERVAACVVGRSGLPAHGSWICGSNSSPSCVAWRARETSGDRLAGTS